jgi:hypothetical protein
MMRRHCEELERRGNLIYDGDRHALLAMTDSGGVK